MKKILYQAVKLLGSTVPLTLLNIGLSGNFQASYAQENSCNKLFEAERMAIKIKLSDKGKTDSKQITDFEVDSISSKSGFVKGNISYSSEANPANFELQYKGSKWQLNWYDVSGNKLVGKGTCNSDVAIGKMEYAKDSKYSKDGKYSYRLRFEPTN
ncbi:MAG: hypothetical protein AAFQ91_08090 [Cyanobacteria bacterium J06621_15]